MANLKEIQGKINSLKKTQKITSAMKMISTTKLNRCLSYILCAKDYRQELFKIASNLGDHFKHSPHPLLKEKRKVKRIKLINLTSNRGLCGAFNAYVCKNSVSFLQKNQDKHIEMDCYGSKGFEFFETQQKKKTISLANIRLKDFPSTNKNEELGESTSFDLPAQKKITQIVQELKREFLNDEIDEIYLSYNYFYSRITQKPHLEKFLPLEKKITPAEEQKKKKSIWLFEPNVKTLIEELLDLFITQGLYFSFLSTLVGEHAARMTAMDSASNNCGDLIEKYTLEKNRTRQAAITTELTEIISGSESL